MNYVPVTVDNLAEIQNEVMSLFPKENEKRTVLFYIENNVEEFLKLKSLREQLERLGLLDYVSNIAFHHVLPTAPQGATVHIDHSKSTYSFNLPIKNCDNTFVNFYRTDSVPETRLNSVGVPYYHLDESKCSFANRIEMSQPYIINVKVPHNVVNANLKNRITLLIRLKPEWDHLAWISRQSKSQDVSNCS